MVALWPVPSDQEWTEKGSHLFLLISFTSPLSIRSKYGQCEWAVKQCNRHVRFTTSTRLSVRKILIHLLLSWCPPIHPLPLIALTHRVTDPGVGRLLGLSAQVVPGRQGHHSVLPRLLGRQTGQPVQQVSTAALPGRRMVRVTILKYTRQQVRVHSQHI